MPRFSMKMASLVAGCCLGLAASMANAQMADGAYSGSGQTVALDCHGGKAAVAGSNNVLSFTGGCTKLALSGSGNKIRIRFGADPKVSIAGSGNAIFWSSASGIPHVSVYGPNNTFNPPVN